MCDVKNGLGKFEGEPCYAETVYDAALNGECDALDFANGDTVDLYEPDDEFRAVHGIAADVVAIAGEESSQGFYSTRELTAEELAQLRTDAENSKPTCGKCGKECDPDTYSDEDIGECCAPCNPCKYGPVQHARFTGEPHRKCEKCGWVTLDLTDDDTDGGE